MRTDDLIVRLAQSATPVTPLPPPSARLARWAALSIAVAALVVFVIGPRADLLASLGRAEFASSLALLLVATIASAGAAFVASVPGADRSPLLRAVPILALAGWLGLWLVLALSSTHVGRVFHVACAIEILGIAILCGIALFAMIRKAAPLRKGWTAAMAGLAAVTIGAAATQIICPVDDATHQLVGHGVMAIVVGVAGAFAGRISLLGVNSQHPR